MAKKTIPAAEEEMITAEAVPDETAMSAEDERDKRIAILEAQLAAERQKSAGYRTGNDAKIVEQAIQEAIAEGKNLWNETVSVRVPERRDTSEKSYWIMVNGRSVQIPANNQYQEMKLPFADALMKMLQADKYAQNFADNEIQVYDPFTNPHPEK